MKNERAIIMGLAYFIGFTTAFIGYGLSTKTYLAPLVAVEEGNNLAAVSSVLTPETSDLSASTPTPDSADDLTMTVGSETRLISAAYAAVPELGDEAHLALYAVTLNQKTKQLFFCKTTVSTPDTCTAYMYDWDKNGLYAVGKDGAALTFSSSTLSAKWLANGALRLNDLVSVSAAAPWEF